MVTVLEKNDNVLWAFMPNGIILHNYERREFIELQGLEADVWAYCDGAHTVEDIHCILSIHQNGNGVDVAQVCETVRKLTKAGFLRKRE